MGSMLGREALIWSELMPDRGYMARLTLQVMAVHAWDKPGTKPGNGHGRKRRARVYDFGEYELARGLGLVGRTADGQRRPTKVEKELIRRALNSLIQLGAIRRIAKGRPGHYAEFLLLPPPSAPDPVDATADAWLTPMHALEEHDDYDDLAG